MVDLNIESVKLETRKRPQQIYSLVGGKNSYLLESAEKAEKIARYSMIGYQPLLKIAFKGEERNLEINDERFHNLKLEKENPLDCVKDLISRLDVTIDSSLQDMRFQGGFVGYLSYDYIRYEHELEKKEDDLGHKDCEFLLTKYNIVFDHESGEIFLLQIGKEDIQKEKERIENLPGKNPSFSLHPDEKARSNFTKEEYMRAVKQAKEYIRRGEIFQVVLSQRLERPFEGDAFLLYDKIKRMNPSPYTYYLDFGQEKILGCSPEMLVRVENRKVETYPIAGTRARGRNEKEDRYLEQELKEDEKEQAEHVMLVDLGRNDIGKVAEYGTVKVERFMEVEKFSHVQHLVSKVKARLAEDEDMFSALKAVFPAGTVTGAPKVRAMEIINELEPVRRGAYAGCVGYFSFSNSMDTAITIRSIFLKDQTAYVQAGAGVVADSVPEEEYEETLGKARALIEAMEEIK